MMAILNFTKEKIIRKVVEIDINLIVFDQNKSHDDFQDIEVSTLAESILKNGFLQPLSVKKCGDCFELITGEKYLKAAVICGLKSVPCIIHEVNDRDSAIIALVENIKHQDLSFFDEAEAIEKLITYYGMTQEDAASKLGKAQSTIANKLRLLRLTSQERELIVKSGLTERHARALLKLASTPDRLVILEKIVSDNLNVERTERLIEDFIGSQREKANYKKRSKVFQNVKIFVNALNKTVETMQSAGIPANSQKIQHDDYIEYRIRIPVQKVK
ncbi:MAG: ParB/RepB/Spo0J family partition protein [Ruminococcus sp.]|nr:ParB/RepB/Spo0J family partition protein [Ruminococcus sp.]